MILRSNGDMSPAGVAMASDAIARRIALEMLNVFMIAVIVPFAIILNVSALSPAPSSNRGVCRSPSCCVNSSGGYRNGNVLQCSTIAALE
jgi:hypothetical protein